MNNFRNTSNRLASSYSDKADAVVNQQAGLADGKFEDVEFSYEEADRDDLKALERAKQADERAEQS
ncbi:YfhD family protein [Paenibacillus alvei]|uniref:YfhD family protein n=1 Tax=Paenibacillus alvei TaxID=44250 RepID=UPI0018CE1080|nr:YfhD family protein [Paenibacillus alvei]MBG9734146.1 protease [Paenibacillus alvei]MBG9744511.1 protease [Paenibacillus alvei]MCY9582234.1 YfhD family protein [Paenibacillus alvei]MCY9587036.1 YfhD family protein [Paenibacillus alvei]